RRAAAQRPLEALDGRRVGDEVAGQHGLLDAAARERQVRLEDAELGGDRRVPVEVRAEAALAEPPRLVAGGAGLERPLPEAHAEPPLVATPEAVGDLRGVERAAEQPCQAGRVPG